MISPSVYVYRFGEKYITVQVKEKEKFMLNLCALKWPLIRITISLSLAILLLSSNAMPPVHAAGGDLDLTFGSGGKVFTDFFGSRDELRAMALQTDGKIVLTGIVQRSDDFSTSDFGLARYNPDGSLDSTFGSGGKVVTDFTGSFDEANSVAIQTDGKIVVAGEALFNSGFHVAIARYNSNGSLDPTFGTGGKASVEFISGAIDQCEAVALQADGKIIAVGQVFDDSTGVVDFALARFNTDGSFDSTFGTGGKLTTDFFNTNDGASDVAIQPDGKIIAGGFAFNPSTGGGDQALARYNTDGSLDATFGAGGKATGDLGSSSEDCRAIALQPDGKILAAGVANGFDLFAFDFALARYDGGGFDICLQDDSNGNLLQFNSTTGDYRFSNCRKGLTLTGRGRVSIRFCKVELQVTGTDRSISALANTCAHSGTASIRDSSRNQTFTITDRDITNNTCSCR